jgi:hypothetical protein
MAKDIPVVVAGAYRAKRKLVGAIFFDFGRPP